MNNLDDIGEKYCIQCGETKLTSFFYKNKLRPDGIGVYCKICAEKYRKKQCKGKTKRIHPDACSVCGSHNGVFYSRTKQTVCKECGNITKIRRLV